MAVLADLHLHTTASDGRLTVGELGRQIAAARLAYFSITDHDSVVAYGQLDQLPAGLATKLITGIEFSTDVDGEEVHILGYGIDAQNDALLSSLTNLAGFRRERLTGMTQRLRQHGYSIDDDEVFSRFPAPQAVGRPHLAAYLVDKGYFTDVNAIFATLLSKTGPVYLPHVYLPPAKIVELIRACGGIACVAHPGAIGKRHIVEEVIGLGIQGLEVYHPSHTFDQQSAFLAFARRRGLLVTGGSDFHAIPGRIPEQLGVYGCPVLCAETLRASLA